MIVYNIYTISFYNCNWVYNIIICKLTVKNVKILILEITEYLISNLISDNKDYQKLAEISSLILCNFSSNEEMNNYFFDLGLHKILV